MVSSLAGLLPYSLSISQHFLFFFTSLDTKDIFYFTP